MTIHKFAIIFGSDYWNLTAASLSTLTGTYNKTAAGTGNETEAVNLTDLDLTPQFSYTNSSHDYGCESGAGLCAPVGLCWSCGDQVTSLHHSLTTAEQVLRPARQYQGSPLKPSQLSVFLHMPGLLLEPAWPTEGNSTWRGFSANWDCEPLIPISIWVKSHDSLQYVYPVLDCTPGGYPGGTAAGLHPAVGGADADRPAGPQQVGRPQGPRDTRSPGGVGRERRA